MWVVALANLIAIVYTNAPNLRREAVLADLCTLLRTHGCPQRRNSVHKCPETAPRGHFCRSVYTPALPPMRRPAGEGSTACSRARRAAGRETPGQTARSRRRGGCRTACSPRRGIVLVRDDPSARPVGSPCEAFPSREAERLASRLEVRHTPRHVSRQLTEQGHPARAISPKPARARTCPHMSAATLTKPPRDHYPADSTRNVSGPTHVISTRRPPWVLVS